MTREEAKAILEDSVIDDSIWKYDPHYRQALQVAIKALESQDGDAISRQAAIDAMCSACGYDCDKSEFVYNAPQDEQVIMCPEHYALSTLPSVQPEIIRCKDCKHADQYNHCDRVAFWNTATDYCSKAERREDV